MFGLIKKIDASFNISSICFNEYNKMHVIKKSIMQSKKNGCEQQVYGSSL